ncbi:MAG: phosphogluconate dehydrogenase (NAD(+)-dependent, decarboxylating) [Candidatus Dormibacteria bacterium]
MQIGFVGLGRMGANMVHRLRRDGDHAVIAFDPNAEARASVEALGATTAGSLEELVPKLGTPRAVWIMVPSGPITEGTITTLLGHLSTGDTIIDGGNSNFRDSMRRADLCAQSGVDFIDAGTSGGIWGLEVGYCLMAGGADDAIARLRPVLDTLAPPQGFLHVGPPGAGHFVKMVHNGIEYGMLQAYAEGFDLLHEQAIFPALDLHGISHLWNQGSVVRSWLLELAERAFESDNDLGELRGYVDDSGEGRWTLEEGFTASVPMPVLAASLFARYQSRRADGFGNKVVAALRKEFGGHPVQSESATAGSE